MRFYLHAFCLDEGKAKEGHEDMVVGPFEWFQITWDWVRAGDENGNDEDHQFVLDENGYWYPLVHVTNEDTTWRSMQPDYERGRFSDIVIVPESMVEQEKLTVTARTTERITSDQAALEAAKTAEKAWAEAYEG